MRYSDEDRTIWIENRFDELSSNGDYAGYSAEDILDIVEEEFELMISSIEDDILEDSRESDN